MCPTASAITVTAIATPNGTFSDSGLSRDTSRAGIWNRTNATSICQILRAVCRTRLLTTIRTSAISPATTIVHIRTAINRCGPRNAPKAPVSFQSPAPRLRTITSGNSNAKPNPAPSNAVFAPAQPSVAPLAAIPRTNPGTVNQFGIRRQRQSVNPAVAAKIPASTQSASLMRKGRRNAAR
jgi:hypothetical protein